MVIVQPQEFKALRRGPIYALDFWAKMVLYAYVPYM